jgi:hypothetical protein
MMNGPASMVLTETDAAMRWSFELDRTVPGWLVFVLCAAACVLVVLGYRGLDAPFRPRVVLASARVLLILMLLLAIAQPQWVSRTELIEPDVVVVLLDRSASMTIADSSVDGRQVRRGDVLASVVSERQPWNGIGADHRVAWYDFAEHAQRIEAPSETGWSDRAGGGTSIGRAIDEVLNQHTGRPIASVIVLSDGRSEPLKPHLTQRLLESGTPVHTIALGSTTAGRDWRIEAVEAPRTALLRDEVPVRVEIVGPSEEQATIVLEDGETGQVFERRFVTGDEASLWLRASGDEAGNRRWRVRIEPTTADPLPLNNEREHEIELVDRTVRVLYIERLPRWEYRYLRNLLIREPMLDASTFLLSAASGFAQEGNSPIARLPRTAEEWQAYDVIILGDIAPEVLPPEQQQSILEHIADGGAGLLWLAGPEHAPRSWSDAALGTVLPMRDPDLVGVISGPVHVQPTSAADRLGVFAMTTVEAQTAWPILSDLKNQWSAQSIAQLVDPTRLKPTSIVLLRSVQPRAGQKPLPLAISMRYGAGQSVFLGIDEIWRWRRNRTAKYFDQFYVPIVRSLARGRADQHASMALRLSPSRPVAGSPVDVVLSVRDQQLRERIGPTMTVRIRRPDEDPVTLNLQAGTLSDRYVGRVQLAAGRYELTPAVQLDGTEARPFPITVRAANDELLTTEVDHALLETLSRQTGGMHMTHDDERRRELGRWIPNRDRITEHVQRRPVWDTPLAFGLLIALLVVEWIGRRVIRLS